MCVAQNINNHFSILEAWFYELIWHKIKQNQTGYFPQIDSGV